MTRGKKLILTLQHGVKIDWPNKMGLKLRSSLCSQFCDEKQY